MACGESGFGRMAEPEEIFAAIQTCLASANPSSQAAPLAGKKIVITAGPTHEPIDPVRYIANRSSGKQGYAIARAARAAGAEVILVSGPVTLAAPEGVRRYPRGNGAGNGGRRRCGAALRHFHRRRRRRRLARRRRPCRENQEGGKGPPDLQLVENPDILAKVARLARRPAAPCRRLRRGNRKSGRTCAAETGAQRMRSDRGQ